MTGVRPTLLGGVALITLGGLLFLRALGLAVPVAPVVLVAVGAVLVVMARRPGAPLEEEPAILALDGASAARVVLNHGAGTLRVGAGVGPNRLFEGRFTGGVEQRVERSGNRLAVTLQPHGDLDRWLTRADHLAWELALADDVPIDLEVRTGASKVRLDLSTLRIPSLALKTGASDVEIVLPAHGSCSVSISAGAADVRVLVPPGMPAAIANHSALAGFSIDEQRFPRFNGTYRSPDYDAASERAEIDIEGGVGSFSVR